MLSLCTPSCTKHFHVQRCKAISCHQSSRSQPLRSLATRSHHLHLWPPALLLPPAGAHTTWHKQLPRQTAVPYAGSNLSLHWVKMVVLVELIVSPIIGHCSFNEWSMAERSSHELATKPRSSAYSRSETNTHWQSFLRLLTSSPPWRYSISTPLPACALFFQGHLDKLSKYWKA